MPRPAPKSLSASIPSPRAGRWLRRFQGQSPAKPPVQTGSRLRHILQKGAGKTAPPPPPQSRPCADPATADEDDDDDDHEDADDYEDAENNTTMDSLVGDVSVMSLDPPPPPPSRPDPPAQSPPSPPPVRPRPALGSAARPINITDSPGPVASPGDMRFSLPASVTIRRPMPKGKRRVADDDERPGKKHRQWLV
ncbi:hypothetical protein DFH27DRAFT_583452 [Peziza echinospora]|nr:hypothetical protein DFH27DRAFT_583452 [Peziza echinospora]